MLFIVSPPQATRNVCLLPCFQRMLSILSISFWSSSWEKNVSNVWGPHISSRDFHSPHISFFGSFYLGIGLKIQTLCLKQKGCELWVPPLLRLQSLKNRNIKQMKGKGKEIVSFGFQYSINSWQTAIGQRNHHNICNSAEQGGHVSPWEKQIAYWGCLHETGTFDIVGSSHCLLLRYRTLKKERWLSSWEPFLPLQRTQFCFSASHTWCTYIIHSGTHTNI